jgi:hypothetical protein
MKRSLAVLAVLALLLTGAMVTPVAAGDDDVIKKGSCSKSSTWKLKLSPENGRIEVQFEVDQNVNGQKWRVRLFRNGERFFAGTRTTQAPSGSFEVRRVVDDGFGPDVIKARARNLSSDELCRGKATF